jgi:NitT/TauT family transport system substrate-binding protein
MSRLMFATAAALVLSTGAALAQSPTAVKLGWGAFPDIAQLAVAQDKNLWKDQNITMEVIPFATGRDGFEAMIGGQVDFAIMAEFPAVTGAMRNLKFVVPASLAKYAKVRAHAKSPTPVTSLQQLAGKKVGVSMGGNIHFIIADALKKAGVTVELINVAPGDIIPAMVRGDIYGSAMFPSAYEAAKKTLGDQYQEIPLPGYASTFVLAASDKVATDNPDLIRRVLAVLLKGEEFVKSDPEGSKDATLKFAGKSYTKEMIDILWPQYEHRITLDKFTLNLMVQQGQWLRENNFVKEGTPSVELYSKYMVTGPLKALAPDRVEIN